LPEWEPLTPELAEEEAMRGDFMLRWAVVLMAFLMACTEISTTSTLTHIKSGEQLSANGYLPSGTDTLSYAAKDLEWSNLNWLFDIVVAQIHAAAGPTGLTLFKALLIAIAFGALVHTSIPGVSTWWNSICCAVALIVAYPRFSATPDIITLLGLALTFRWLQNWRNGTSKGFPWQIPVLFVVWANMDARMFLGVLLVLAYVIGDQVSGWFRKGESVETTSSAGWVLAALCVVAACVNPATFQTLTAPINLYQVEYPAMQEYHSVSTLSPPTSDSLQYYPATAPAFWKWLDQSAIAAIALLLIVVLMFVVYFEGIEFGHLLALLCFAGVAGLATHELGALAIVAAGIASACGQKWYRTTFKQEYTVDTKELVFSRGGRAITVLAMFAMAFFFASGRISNSSAGDAPRVGLGFEPNLDNAITGLKSDLSEFDAELRVFNFTMEQGDLLAWIGQPYYLDSRARLFAGTSVLADHDATRRAVRAKRENAPGSGEPDVWKKTFVDYEIQLAMPRMYGEIPDIVTFIDMSQSSDWKLLQMGASSATFVPTMLLEQMPLAVLSEKFGDDTLIESAFRKDADDESFERPDWPRRPTFNQQYLFPVRNVRTESFLRARNFHSQIFNTQPTEANLPNLIALAYRTIRDANRTLAQDPNNAGAYRLLGSIYGMLGNIETAQFGGGPDQMRYYQKIAALNQALVVEPDHMPTLEQLMQTYGERGMSDLAVPLIERLIELMEATNPTDPRDLEKLKTWYTARDQLAGTIEANSERLDGLLADIPEEQRAAANRQLAEELQQQGFVNQALSLLGDDIYDSTRDAYTQALYGSLLLEAGRVEDASNVLQKIRSAAMELPAQYAGIPWQFSMAMASIANGSYAIAEGVFDRQALELAQTVSPQRLHSMRLAMLPAAWMKMQAQTAVNDLAMTPLEVAQLRFHAAICYLEEGKTTTAGKYFRTVLTDCPDSPLRNLSKFYLDLITGEDYQLDQFDDWIALAPDDESATDDKGDTTVDDKLIDNKSAGDDTTNSENKADPNEEKADTRNADQDEEKADPDPKKPVEKPDGEKPDVEKSDVEKSDVEKPDE
jgi:tetratricopeptide (TPR) repeat protein